MEKFGVGDLWHRRNYRATDTLFVLKYIVQDVSFGKGQAFFKINNRFNPLSRQ